ncbi:MAG: site-2 protease family protein [Christensenella sp.]|nr:site-2 protease family protein [Christensenella sp.]
MIFLGASFVSVLQWIGYILVALLCLMFMIVVHEAGHYIAGKIFKFHILEFSIGFGPKLFQTTNKKTGEKFSIRCIPLGGYCQFDGEDEEGSSEDTFNSKPIWQRIIVLFAGAFMNLISAILIIMIFFMAWGDYLPKVYKTYDYVDTAYVQQLQEGDIIYKVDGKNCYSLVNTTKLQNRIKGKEQVELTILRDGEEVIVNVSLQDYKGTTVDQNNQEIEVSGHGLGISVVYEKTQLGFFSAIARAFEFCWEVISLIFVSIGSLFSGGAKVSETLGGTVTAISALAELTKYGFASVMYGVCVLSASVGVMNLLPFPALDGCRILVCIIEAIIRKPINRKVEGIINFCGLIILFGMAILFDLLHFLG